MNAQYKVNGQGHLVPIETIAQIDLARDELVMEIVAKAKVLQEDMRKFKEHMMGDIAAFVSLSAEKYQAHIGGTKGNITLSSYDGKYRVSRRIADSITFDERLHIAKELIDKCILRWSEGSNPQIRALVQHAFQVDKTGKINTSRVLGLTRLDIVDPDWANAMQAIRDAIQVVSSKAYVTVHERVGDGDNFRQISLDIAGL